MKDLTISLVGILFLAALCCYPMLGQTVTLEKNTLFWLVLAGFIAGGVLIPSFLMSLLVDTLKEILGKK